MWVVIGQNPDQWLDTTIKSHLIGRQKTCATCTETRTDLREFGDDPWDRVNELCKKFHNVKKGTQSPGRSTRPAFKKKCFLVLKNNLKIHMVFFSCIHEFPRLLQRSQTQWFHLGHQILGRKSETRVTSGVHIPAVFWTLVRRFQTGPAQCLQSRPNKR